LIILSFLNIHAQTTTNLIKIGIAFDSGGLGDNSFNDSAYEGIVEVSKILMVMCPIQTDRVSAIMLKYVMPFQGPTRFKNTMRYYANLLKTDIV